MTIEARRIEAIETTLSKDEWIALISAAGTFATAVLNAVPRGWAGVQRAAMVPQVPPCLGWEGSLSHPPAVAAASICRREVSVMRIEARPIAAIETTSIWDLIAAAVVAAWVYLAHWRY